MKAYFDGEKGINVLEQEIPAELLEDAKKYRAELVEKVCETDDAAMTAFLEGKELSIDELKKIIRKAVIANKIFPVFTGSALKNVGVQLVLDAVVDYLPSPLDLPPVKGIDPNTGETIFRKPDDSSLSVRSLSNYRTTHSSDSSHSSEYTQEQSKLVHICTTLRQVKRNALAESSDFRRTIVKK
jgi:translation elongation factor EF-G